MPKISKFTNLTLIVLCSILLLAVAPTSLKRLFLFSFYLDILLSTRKSETFLYYYNNKETFLKSVTLLLNQFSNSTTYTFQCKNKGYLNIVI